jgi:hypothetical protein
LEGTEELYGKRIVIRSQPEQPVSGWFYRPSEMGTGLDYWPEGKGNTNPHGDIRYSNQGGRQTVEGVYYHERVHQMLTPKFVPLRTFRIRQRKASYTRSSLSRYIEEVLAETNRNLKAMGMSLPKGFAWGFPMQDGYVFVWKKGSQIPNLTRGNGVVPELGALIAIATYASEIYHIHFTPNRNPGQSRKK